MAEVFTTSGKNSDNITAPSPQLQGLFVPGIDNSFALDGFGIVTPWGGGRTARRYADYGVSGDISRQTTQLNDLASSLIPAEGGAAYNLEGLVGPQGPIGPPGPRGLPGVTGITSLPSGYVLPTNANFLADLPHNIDGINDLGTAADKLVYTSEYSEDTTTFAWESASLTLFSDDIEVNNDGSFCIIAAEGGIRVSTDLGASWTSYDPGTEDYDKVSCAGSGGKAVALGATTKTDGTFWRTDDYGVSWTEVEVTT